MDKTEEIIKKIGDSNWAHDNPDSKNEIIDFLKEVRVNYDKIPGYIKVLRSILSNLNDPISLKWFNYFSQIRCAYFLAVNGQKITTFDKKYSNKVLDLEINGDLLCEIKSFEPNLKTNSTTIQNEEFVFNNFLKNKLIPAFENQKADLVIIDDIFSYESKNYRFLNYFMSFVNEPNTDRCRIIHNKLDKYLPKILMLSFTQSLTKNPINRFLGDEWKKILEN